MRNRHITLDPRLTAIAALVGQCDTCADIGTDHGRLGAYLLQTGQVGQMVFTDISGESLAKARRLIGHLGLSHRADFRVGDGALALDAPPEAAVIAGMGGSTIAHIIREGREKLSGTRLILQPNVAAPELRQALCDCGFRIRDERVVPDGRRQYVVIAAEPGEAHYNEEQLTVGPVLLRDLPPSLAPYAAFRLRVARKALAGAMAGGDAAQIEALNREIDIWEEVRACLPPSDSSSKY